MDQTGKLVSSSLPAPASQSDSSIEPPARPAFQPDSSTEPPARPAFQPDSIAEEDEDDEKEKTTENPPAGAAGSGTGSGGPCRWAVDLAGTEPYWRGWFEHLSAAFLDVATAKLLLLAGVDRLDRDLTVGQMQVFFFLSFPARSC
jgi:protein phosphatase methylesterase 1